MNRKIAIAYGIVITGLACLIVAKLGQREAPSPLEETNSQPEKIRSPLSAILIPEKTGGGNQKTVSDLRSHIERLQIQRDSLQARVSGAPTDENLVEVDLKTLCEMSDLIHDSLGNTIVEKGNLAVTLALNPKETSAFYGLVAAFRESLHELERDSAVELQEPSDPDSGEIQPGQHIIKIQPKAEGRSELFDEFEERLGELLGSARGRTAAASLAFNSALGHPDRSKEYHFIKRPDGSLDLRTKLVEQVELFPGTDIPYDGTPGIEPDVRVRGRSSASSTLTAEEAEATFGTLIDLSSLPTVEK